MTLLPAITAALYFTLYPAICLAHCMVAALQLFLSPFVDLALLVLHTALLPWRILAKFQALFEFLAIATLAGVIAGLVLHYTSTFLYRVLRLSSEPTTPLSGRKKGLRAVQSPSRTYRTHESRLSEIPMVKGPVSVGSLKSTGYPSAGWGSRNMRGLQHSRLFTSTIFEGDSQESDEREGDE